MQVQTKIHIILMFSISSMATVTSAQDNNLSNCLNSGFTIKIKSMIDTRFRNQLRAALSECEKGEREKVQSMVDQDYFTDEVRDSIFRSTDFSAIATAGFNLKNGDSETSFFTKMSVYSRRNSSQTIDTLSGYETLEDKQ